MPIVEDSLSKSARDEVVVRSPLKLELDSQRQDESSIEEKEKEADEEPSIAIIEDSLSNILSKADSQADDTGVATVAQTIKDTSSHNELLTSSSLKKEDRVDEPLAENQNQIQKTSNCDEIDPSRSVSSSINLSNKRNFLQFFFKFLKSIILFGYLLIYQ